MFRDTGDRTITYTYAVHFTETTTNITEPINISNAYISGQWNTTVTQLQKSGDLKLDIRNTPSAMKSTFLFHYSSKTFKW